MKTLYVIFVESLDMELEVFADEAEAKAYFDRLKNQGKAVHVSKFYDYQICNVMRSNGERMGDPGYWEEITYDNGKMRLVETYTWHEPPQKEGYYPEYIIQF